MILLVQLSSDCVQPTNQQTNLMPFSADYGLGFCVCGLFGGTIIFQLLVTRFDQYTPDRCHCIPVYIIQSCSVVYVCVCVLFCKSADFFGGQRNVSISVNRHVVSVWQIKCSRLGVIVFTMVDCTSLQ